MIYIFGLTTFLVAILCTFGVRAFARRFKVLDTPSGRKVHRKPMPLLGGVALYVALVVGVFLVLFVKPEALTINMSVTQLLVVGVAGLLIIIGGIVDDIYNLPPRYQFIFPIVAVLFTLWGGVELKEITNPVGGVLQLDQWRLSLGPVGTVLVIGDVLVILWLLGMSYTSKLLDGLDGLTTGIVGIGAMMIFALSQFTRFYQPDVALLSLMLAAVCGAFLLFNFYPASIFLGEGGSLFLGYMLGVLAIIAGGKIATTLLVMGIPILDVVWVISRRAMQGRKVTMADAGHLHHRLLRNGFSHRGAVLFMYVMSIAFGSLTLVLQSRHKLLVLLGGIPFMMILGYWLVYNQGVRKV